MSKKSDSSKTEPVLADEIESLNVDDLDIEELERRIELASAMPTLPDGWICGADCGSNCQINCGSNCLADCGTNSTCGLNGCASNGGGCVTNGGCIGPDGSVVSLPECA